MFWYTITIIGNSLSMNRNRVILGIIALVVIIGSMFAYAYMKRDTNKIEVETEQQPDTQNDEYGNIDRIVAKHFFEKGEHTVAGEILMPTPCDLLEWDPIIRESMPEQVTINFTVINHSETCVQSVTPQRFKVSFKGNKDATIDATFNGRPVILNLVPAGPNETPDDFELFIKG